MEEIKFIAIGILIGWITKVPLLIKWYRELQETKDYKNRRTDAFLEEIKRLEAVYKKTEQCDNCSPAIGYYLGTTCPKCSQPFRSVRSYFTNPN